MEDILDLSKVMQDKNDFIWIATSNGLQRYDGEEFVFFPKEGANHYQMDSDGNIWGLEGNNVFMFDTKKCQFIDILGEYRKQAGNTCIPRKIRTMPDGYTWIICDDEICLRVGCDNHTTDITEILCSQGKVETIFADRYNQTWVMTSKATFIFTHEKKCYRLKTVFRSQALTDNILWLLTDKGELCYYSHKGHKVMRYSPLRGREIEKFKNQNSYAWEIDNVFAISGHEAFLLSNSGKMLKQVPTAETDNFFIDSKGRQWFFSSARYYFEDNYGTVWVVLNDGTLNYIDQPSGSLQSVDLGISLKNCKQFFRDHQGALWIVENYKLYTLSFRSCNYEYEKGNHVRLFFQEPDGTYWIAERDNPVVRVYNKDNTLKGYLGSDGKVHSSYAEFQAKVYAICRDRRGALWIGTKPKGLFRIGQDGKMRNFSMESGNSLNCNEIIAICEDKIGRLWLATFGGGLNCIVNPEADNPDFLNADNSYFTEITEQRMRRLLLTHDGILLATALDGLYIADTNIRSLKKITLKHHQNEPKRKNSIASNHIKGMLETNDGIYLCTENRGMEYLSKHQSLTANELNFQHYDIKEGMPSQVCQAVINCNGRLWVTSTNQLIEISIPSTSSETNSPTMHSHLYDSGLMFSEATPIRLSDGRWLFGLHNGRLLTDLDISTSQRARQPKIVITSVMIHDNPANNSYTQSDTIRLKSDERSLMLRFAALDYTYNAHISYAYRLSTKTDGSTDSPATTNQQPPTNNDNWQYVGRNNSLSFVNMSPGKYTLQLRSTDASGSWTDNVRTITIIVTPTFWETGWAKVLYAIIILLLIYIAYRIHSYISSIRHQHKEALDAYLQLLSDNKTEAQRHEEHRKQLLEQAKVEAQNDAIMQRIMKFIDQHISDSDININDMAREAAVSRSLLHEKTKQIFGLTPGKLISEARIQKACQMLHDDKRTINEVAFMCGFSDPKYFSKCFKSSTGQTPTEYRLKI